MRLIGERDLLCIDWDERSLRVVNAGFSRGKPFVRTAFAAPMPAGLDMRDPQAMGAFLRKALAEHRVRARWAMVSVPRQDAVMTLLSLPKGTTDEMAAMVHMQVGRELPFARDQAVIDFAVARMEENSPTCEVWAAAVRTSLIDHLEQVVTAAGLRISRIGLRSYGNLIAAQATGELPTRTVMVDVGASMTEINVIREGRLVFSRAASVSIPPEGLDDPSRTPLSEGAIPFVEDYAPSPRAMDSLLVEVSRTIEAYRASDPGARVDEIILAGSAGISADCAQAFENRFGVPTRIFEPPESLGWEEIGISAAPFSAALGLALSGTGESLYHFNFDHPKEPEAEHRERVRRRPAMILAGLAVAAAFMYMAYLPIANRNAEIARLQAELNAANADKKMRDELKKQIADVRTWQSQNVVWLDTLRQIATDVYTSNKDAFLTRLDIQERGLIKLELAAADNKVATVLVKNAQKLVAPDSSGKKEVPVFSSWPGDWNDGLPDPKYPVKDEVYLQVNALQQSRSRR